LGAVELQRITASLCSRRESFPATRKCRSSTRPQIKHANFDITHEFDEFLMVERPLTHTKRKANADLDKLKPELRQLEEQYVPSVRIFHSI
jgi:serine/threonine kinase 32